MFKMGDVLFFKQARRSTKRSAETGTFKGFGFGVYLGHVPPFAKDPDQGILRRLMGSIGYVLFDDVGEFLGNEAGAECVKKFEAKYYSPQGATDQPELPIEGKETTAAAVSIKYHCPKCKDQDQVLLVTQEDIDRGEKNSPARNAASRTR